jgi:hypothetical protein
MSTSNFETKEAIRGSPLPYASAMHRRLPAIYPHSQQRPRHAHEAPAATHRRPRFFLLFLVSSARNGRVRTFLPPFGVHGSLESLTYPAMTLVRNKRVISSKQTGKTRSPVRLPSRVNLSAVLILFSHSHELCRQAIRQAIAPGVFYRHSCSTSGAEKPRGPAFDELSILVEYSPTSKTSASSVASLRRPHADVQLRSSRSAAFLFRELEFWGDP